MTKKRNIAVIPAYEPDERLTGIVSELDSLGFCVIVVDDGSGEDYKDLFLSVADKAIVLNHKLNAGKGAALKTAFSFIRNNYDNDCSIVTLDSDGQHSITDAIKVISAAYHYPDCLFIGSRRLGDNAPLRSRFGNCVTRNVFRLFSNKRVYDTQSGLRAFSSRHLDYFISVSGERYEYEMNILLKCGKNGIDIKEIPIDTIYYDNNSGSHFKTVRDSARIYKDIIKYKFKK